jgi:hypothetical protein
LVFAQGDTIPLRATFQIRGVSKPIPSVAELSAVGHKTVFEDEYPCIRLRGGSAIPLIRHFKSFYLKVSCDQLFDGLELPM